MSVIFIGNRAVGKTSMIVALAKGTVSKKNKNVRIITPNPQDLIEQFSFVPSNNNSEKEGFPLASDDENFSQKIPQTEEIEIAGTYQLQAPRSLLLSVDLPSGVGKEIRVDWIDTPGEAWSNPDWRKKNPEDYEKLLETVSKSLAVVLLVPPYIRTNRPIVSRDNTKPPDQLNMETWRTQLKEWLALIRKNCSNVKHLVIAIHKADLWGYDLQKDHEKWQYNAQKRQLINWFKYNQHIKDTYFDLALDIIREHNSKPPYLSPRFFVTTIKNPNLLELPWVYLGSQLAYV
ncbi:MAG: hypothetical protein QNJ33_04815 [Crocosphaera sp.]|nr:hypothetical protein [Crocosphaera sp.]